MVLACAASAMCGCLVGGETQGGVPAAEGASGAGVALVYEQVVDGNRDLYVVPAGGGAARRLTRDPGEDSLPRFTPDGRTVVFSSDRTGNWQLWQVRAEGGQPTRVRTNAFTEWQADASPDGRWLAFLSDAEGPEYLLLMERRSGATRTLVRHGARSILGNPDWSPDGRRIVFSSNRRLGHEIYVVDVATGAQERISGLEEGGCEPRFRPDGRRVAYVRRGHLADSSRLVEHDLDSGEKRVLVDWPALNYDPVYSPDASEIAFVSNVTGEYHVYRQRLSDGKAWRMTFGDGGARNPDYGGSGNGVSVGVPGSE